MHRLLVPSEQLASDSPVLPKEAANHLKVLRPKDGEETARRSSFSMALESLAAFR